MVRLLQVMPSVAVHASMTVNFFAWLHPAWIVWTPRHILTVGGGLAVRVFRIFGGYKNIMTSRGEQDWEERGLGDKGLGT